jgi:hypothetical protein
MSCSRLPKGAWKFPVIVLNLQSPWNLGIQEEQRLADRSPHEEIIPKQKQSPQGNQIVSSSNKDFLGPFCRKRIAININQTTI